MSTYQLFLSPHFYSCARVCFFFFFFIIAHILQYLQVIALLRDPARRTRSRYMEQKYLNGPIWQQQVQSRNIQSLEELAARDAAMIRECLLSTGNPYSTEGIDCVRPYNMVSNRATRVCASIHTHVHVNQNNRVCLHAWAAWVVDV